MQGKVMTFTVKTLSDSYVCLGYLVGCFDGGILNSGFSTKWPCVLRIGFSDFSIHKWNFQKSWLTWENLKYWLKKQNSEKNRRKIKISLNLIFFFFMHCVPEMFSPPLFLYLCAYDNALFIVGFTVCFLCKFRSSPPDRSLHRCHHRIKASGSFFLYCLWVFTQQQKTEQSFKNKMWL